MKRTLTLALFGLTLMASPAQGQQSAQGRIEAAKRRAATAGIPVALLESRVAEGRAKGVPMDRIAAVVERRAAALLEAREAMAAVPRLNEADLAAGADAVEAGIGGQTLRAVLVGAREEDRPVAIAVLTYLHREQGLPVDQALARVRGAVGKGPEALRQLPAQARGNRGRGRPEGVGGPPGQAGKGRPTGGPPSAVPTPGTKPGSGKPDNPGKGKGKGKPGSGG